MIHLAPLPGSPQWDGDLGAVQERALADAAVTDHNRPDIASAMSAGQEFFLDHRLYRSHRDGAVVNSAFTRLSFPPWWHYDLLRGLDHFQNTAAPMDERVVDALEVLASRRRADGTWPVQNRHAGREFFEMERVGGPSRWNTLRALRVQKWAVQG